LIRAMPDLNLLAQGSVEPESVTIT
jgi:hypothetical protein